MYLQAYLIGSTYLGNIHNLTGKCTFSLYTLSDDTVQQVLKHTHTHTQSSSYHIPGFAKYRSSKDSFISSFDREIS